MMFITTFAVDRRVEANYLPPLQLEHRFHLWLTFKAKGLIDKLFSLLSELEAMKIFQ